MDSGIGPGAHTSLGKFLKSLSFYALVLVTVLILGFILTEMLPKQVVKSPDGSWVQSRLTADTTSVFYWSIRPKWLPPELNNELSGPAKSVLKKRIWKEGNGKAWLAWDRRLREVLAGSLLPQHGQALQSLRFMEDRKQLKEQLLLLPDSLTKVLLPLPSPKNGNTWSLAFAWNSNNRFDQWMFGSENQQGIWQGNLGWSKTFQKPVLEVIQSHAPLSIGLSLTSLILGLCLGLVFGIWQVSRPYWQWLQVGLLSIPSFAMGTVLLWLFANPDVLDWLPSGGVAPPGGLSVDTGNFAASWGKIKYLVMPLICFSYGSIASFALLSQNHISQLTKEAWFATAKAKGLSQRRALWVHAVPNALPLLQTRFFQSLPFVLSGSVVLETLFSLPGLGAVGVKAVFNQDQGLLIGLLMAAALLTLLGFLISDGLQYLLDPKGRKPMKP